MYWVYSWFLAWYFDQTHSLWVGKDTTQKKLIMNAFNTASAAQGLGFICAIFCQAFAKMAKSKKFTSAKNCLCVAIIV